MWDMWVERVGTGELREDALVMAEMGLLRISIKLWCNFSHLGMIGLWALGKLIEQSNYDCPPPWEAIQLRASKEYFLKIIWIAQKFCNWLQESTYNFRQAWIKMKIISFNMFIIPTLLILLSFSNYCSNNWVKLKLDCAKIQINMKLAAIFRNCQLVSHKTQMHSSQSEKSSIMPDNSCVLWKSLA